MRPMPTLDEVDPHDVIEVGDRAAMGLYGENTGLTHAQRLPAITQRRPAGITWRLHWGSDGMCTGMSWPAWDGRGAW